MKNIYSFSGAKKTWHNSVGHARKLVGSARYFSVWISLKKQIRKVFSQPVRIIVLNKTFSFSNQGSSLLFSDNTEDKASHLNHECRLQCPGVREGLLYKK